MDAIAAFDKGVAAHFWFVSRMHPEIVAAMQIPYYFSTYYGATATALAAVLFFIWQGKPRAALVAVLSFVSAAGFIEALKILVPRARPEDALHWVGAESMRGSYPSAGALLFMLAAILLGIAVWQFSERRLVRVLYLAGAAALTVWICLSQFFLGLHHLSDIIGGLAGAALFGWIAYLFLRAPSTDDRAPEAAPNVSSAAIQDLSRPHGMQK